MNWPTSTGNFPFLFQFFNIGERPDWSFKRGYISLRDFLPYYQNTQNLHQEIDQYNSTLRTEGNNLPWVRLPNSWGPWQSCALAHDAPRRIRRGGNRVPRILIKNNKPCDKILICRTPFQRLGVPEGFVFTPLFREYYKLFLIWSKRHPFRTFLCFQIFSFLEKQKILTKKNSEKEKQTQNSWVFELPVHLTVHELLQQDRPSTSPLAHTMVPHRGATIYPAELMDCVRVAWSYNGPHNPV